MTMDDFRRRFASLDAVAVPDLAAEIDRRTAALAVGTVFPVAGRTTRRSTVTPGRAGWGRRFAAVPVLLVALLLVALIATLALGGGWWLRSIVPPPTSSTTLAPSALPSVDASPSRSTPPRLGVIAYAVCSRPDPQGSTPCGGDWRIWVVNADGTGAHELLPDEPGSQQPITWSPDGSKLLYSSDALGEDLAMTDAAGSEPEVLPNESLCPIEATNCHASLGSIRFSPDGARLAYAIFTRADGSGCCGLDDGVIAVREMATARVTTLDASRIPGPLQCCDGYYAPSWSADGTRLAFAMPPLASFTIEVDGSDLRRITPAGEYGTAPKWSPDGAAIATSLGGSTPVIYAVGPAGGDVRTVARDASDPEWTLEGRLVFTRSGGNWIMDADGGSVRRLDDTIAALTAAGCMVCAIRDGDRLVGPGLWQPVPGIQP